uniref:Dynactin subunit 6 n=1 Tax=Propithecus coquereli TaxID=379532 RepID=A0A2K6FDT0_PROCO
MKGFKINNVKIAPGAAVCVESEIGGDITMGPRTLIHPKARIIVEARTIAIGENNITPDTKDPEPKPMMIGTNNVFEVDCRNVILTSGCITGACRNLNTFEITPENMVIYGADCLRRVQTEGSQPQTLQLDFLMKILPNYHHLKKTIKGSSTPFKN